MRPLRSLGVLALLLVVGCATAAPPKKYGWGGGGTSSGGSGTVTSVSGTAPISVATGTTTPVVSIAAATTSTAGAMTAADKTLTTNLSGTWQSRMANFCASKIPQLDPANGGEFQWKPLGLWPQTTPAVNGTPSGSDAAVEGGGVSPTSATGWLAYSQSIIQAPKTGKWCIAWRIRNAAVISPNVTIYGLVSADGTHQLSIGGLNPGFVDATHAYMLIRNGTTNPTANGAVRDLLFHDEVAASDGTTVTWYQDGVAQNTLPSSSFAADEPMYFWEFNTVHLDATATKILYGIIPP